MEIREIPVLVVSDDINQAQILKNNCEKLFWGLQCRPLWIFFDGEVEHDAILKSIVPMIEANQFFLLVDETDRCVKTLSIAYRYLQKPYIYHHLSNSLDVVLRNFIEHKREGKLAYAQDSLIRIDVSAIQKHLFEFDVLDFIEESGGRCLRLGELKNDILLAEANIRDADAIGIQLSAMKKSEMPAKKDNQQSGLFSEEMCQLARYAGFSNKAQNLLIYDFDMDHDRDGISVNVIAQIIYYAIEGFQQRVSEDYSSQDFTKYVVEMDDIGDTQIFLKGNKSLKWWIAPNNIQEVRDNIESYLYACSFKDYETAKNGDIPLNLLKARLWFEKKMLS